MSNVIQGINNALHSKSLYSTQALATVGKGAVIVMVAGAALAGIGYGLETLGQGLVDGGRIYNNRIIENIGNRCQWVGERTHLAGKYTFLSVAVPIYAAGRWTIRVALPKFTNLVNDYVITPVGRAIVHYGPILIDEIARGINLVYNRLLVPINFIRQHCAGIIRQIGRLFDLVARHVIDSLYDRILMPVAREIYKVATYVLGKIADLVVYLANHIFPILNRMLNLVGQVAQFVFEHAIVPFYEHVLVPVGYAIRFTANRVLYPTLNAVTVAAGQVLTLIENVFFEVGRQAQNLFA